MQQMCFQRGKKVVALLYPAPMFLHINHSSIYLYKTCGKVWIFNKVSRPASLSDAMIYTQVFRLALRRRSKRYCHAAAQTRLQRLITLLLLISKKARSVRLLGCKRPRNAAASLPTFFGKAFLSSFGTLSLGAFTCKKIKASSFFFKFYIS